MLLSLMGYGHDLAECIVLSFGIRINDPALPMFLVAGSTPPMSLAENMIWMAFLAISVSMPLDILTLYKL